MAIYMNITVYTSEDHWNNRSDVFKCVKLKGLGCYLAIQPPLKSLPGACDVTSFSPCTDSSHELRDFQHFMSEQIDLHVFKAITAASCVDIIVNKRLNKYN